MAEGKSKGNCFEFGITWNSNNRVRISWIQLLLIFFVDLTQESSQSEEEYPKEKTSSHKKKRHKRSRSKSQESSASESGLRDFLWPLRDIVSREFLHPTWHSV